MDYLASLLNSLINFNNFHIDSFGFMIWNMLSSTNKRNFVEFFLFLLCSHIFYFFVFLYCNGKNLYWNVEYHCWWSSLFPDLKEKAYNFSVLSNMFDVDILYMPLIRLTQSPSLHKVYMTNICWIFLEFIKMALWFSILLKEFWALVLFCFVFWILLLPISPFSVTCPYGIIFYIF